MRLRYLGESSSLSIQVWERSTTLPSPCRCKVKVSEYTSFLCSTLQTFSKLSQETYLSSDTGFKLGMAQDSFFIITTNTCADNEGCPLVKLLSQKILHTFQFWGKANLGLKKWRLKIIQSFCSTNNFVWHHPTKMLQYMPI